MWPCGRMAACDIFWRERSQTKASHIQINPCQRGYSEHKMCTKTAKKKCMEISETSALEIEVEICQWQCTLFRSPKTLFGLGCVAVCRCVRVCVRVCLYEASDCVDV